MGHGFGHLWRYYGLVQYRISPFEQKALKGIIDPGFVNTCKRIASNVPYMGPRKSLIAMPISMLSKSNGPIFVIDC